MAAFREYSMTLLGLTCRSDWTTPPLLTVLRRRPAPQRPSRPTLPGRCSFDSHSSPRQGMRLTDVGSATRSNCASTFTSLVDHWHLRFLQQEFLPASTRVRAYCHYGEF